MITKLKALSQHQGFMRYFQNTSWLMGEKILRMFVGLFVGIWVARYLGPEQFGLLSYAQSFVSLFTAITTLGLDGIVVRELVKDETQRDVLLGTAFGLKLIGAIFILPVLAVAVQFTNNDDYTNLLVFIIASATIFQSFNVIDFYYQSKVLSKYVALANSISFGFSSLIKILLLVNHAPLIAFALIIVVDVFLLALGFIYFYKKTSQLKLFSWSFKCSMAKSLLKDSWPLIFSSLVISVSMRIDQVMIKEMLGIGAVGQYAAAVRISEAWYFIPIVIISSLFPAIINTKKIGAELYSARLQRLYRLMIWLAVGIALPMTLLSDWLVIFLYGVDYVQAGIVLMIHIWAGVFAFLGAASEKWLLAENLQKYHMINTFIGTFINIVLNYFLIEIFGIQGAAYSTLVAYSVVVYFCLFMFKDTRKNFYNMTKSFIFGFQNDKDDT